MRIFLVTLFICFVSIEGKTSECSFNTVDELHFPDASSQIESIDINGRTIYTLFTRHLVNEPVEVRDLIVKFEDGSKTGQKVLKKLNRMILSHGNRVESERKDVLQITKLAQTVPLDWVGVENSEASFIKLGNITGYEIFEFKKIIETMDQDFSSIGEANKEFWNDEKTDRIIHLAFPEIRIAQFKNPQLFNYIDIVYLENPHYEEEITMILETQMKDDVKDMFMSVPEDDMELLISVFDQMDAQELNQIMDPRNLQASSDLILQYAIENNGAKFSPQQRSNIVSDILERSNLNKHGKVVEDFFARILNMLLNAVDTASSFSLKRDQFAVQSVLETQGNGLILRGLVHEKSIKQILIKACEESIQAK